MTMSTRSTRSTSSTRSATIRRTVPHKTSFALLREAALLDRQSRTHRVSAAKYCCAWIAAALREKDVRLAREGLAHLTRHLEAM